MDWDKAWPVTKFVVYLILLVVLMLGQVAAAITLGMVVMVLTSEGGWNPHMSQLVGLVTAMSTCLGLSYGIGMFLNRVMQWVGPPPGTEEK